MKKLMIQGVFKKRAQTILLIFLFSNALSLAARQNDLLIKGNRLYNDQKYSEAVKIFARIDSLGDGNESIYYKMGHCYYEMHNFIDALKFYVKIVDTLGFESGTLYYNMGNCYYNLQDMSMAILYYERAGKLMLGDKDLENNIELARLQLGLGRIEDEPEFIVYRMINSFFHLFSHPVLEKIVAALYLLFIGWLIVWIISRNIILRKVARRGFIVFGIVFLVSGLSLVSRIMESKERDYGIILDDGVEGMNSPNEQSEKVYSISKGTKVRIDGETKEWMKIILNQQDVCWVKKEQLGVI